MMIYQATNESNLFNSPNRGSITIGLENHVTFLFQTNFIIFSILPTGEILPLVYKSCDISFQNESDHLLNSPNRGSTTIGLENHVTFLFKTICTISVHYHITKALCLRS